MHLLFDIFIYVYVIFCYFTLEVNFGCILHVECQTGSYCYNQLFSEQIDSDANL